MSKLTDIGYIKSVLGRNGFTFSKALGQNFLVDPEVCPKMARLCGADDCTGVIEIGPGAGVLTNELALVSRKVVAVELDKRLLPVLAETLAEHDNVKVINGDVIKLDLHKLIEDEFAGMDVVICANLPYYITSPIIMKLLEDRLPVKAITVMVQKEAADRICASPGTRESGAISAAVHYYSEPNKLFAVPKTSFIPSPKVDSAVIRLDVREEPPVSTDDEKLFFRVVKAAFLQRRKTLSNSLSAGLSIPKAKTSEILIQAGIAGNARAEEMTMEQFAAITAAVQQMENL